MAGSRCMVKMELPPGNFGALLPGGLLLPDLGAGHTGELGWVPLMVRLNWPTSPDTVRPELLRAAAVMGS